MAKMFTCTDGTMFPIDDILSVEEAQRSFTTDNGLTVHPIGLSSISEAEALAQRGNELLYEESAVGRAIRHFFIRLFRKDVSWSDEEMRRSVKDSASHASFIDLIRFKKGEVVMFGTRYYVMKQWDVRVRNKRDTIRISNDDYEQLKKVVKE